MLLSLIGEQPIPNLLPIRHLQAAQNLLVYTARTRERARLLRKLIGGSLEDDLQVDAYDFQAILAKLQERLSGIKTVQFNLTGGTKMMALATYALAAQRQADFLYVESEKHHSLLYRYGFENDLPSLREKTLMPTLITAADYLNAHLPGFKETGFSKDDNGQITEGGLFERAVYHALKQRGIEVLSGVRPANVSDQIEIDLVFRIDNQVGIAEVKLGGSESGKRGLDQLKMAGEQIYLGTYTAQFMIVAAPRLYGRAAALANQRGVTVITLPEYRQGQPLPASAVDRLVSQIAQRLVGRTAP
jgi:hypothetical protein